MEASGHYGIDLVNSDDLTDLDAVILAVPHEGLVDLAIRIVNRPTPVLIDVKARVPTDELPPDVICWRL